MYLHMMTKAIDTNTNVTNIYDANRINIKKTNFTTQKPPINKNFH